MSINLLPNRSGQTTGYNSKFSAWTPTVTGSATVPLGTYSATSGPDSTPGLTLSATGTSGGIEAVATVNVAPEQVIVVGVVLDASSASANVTPIQVTFKDALGNSIVTVTPYADAAGVASVTAYNAVITVPDDAATAKVILGYTHWSSTGGYSNVLSSPNVSVI
jgi:hypothetical protein